LELIDRGRIYAVAVRGFSDPFADILRNGDLAAHQPATRPLLGGEQYNHVIDVSQIDHPTFRGAAQEGLGTVLFTALRKDGVLLGMIASARREVRPFADKEIALLENFAAQAVIAMENARLLTELLEALEQQTATAEVLQVINASPGDLTPVFDIILDKAQRVCGVDHAALELYDGECMRDLSAQCIGQIRSNAAPWLSCEPVTSESGLARRSAVRRNCRRVSGRPCCIPNRCSC
jgi:hypothetical protein